LGTSTKKEAIEYFSDFDKHKLDFQWTGDSTAELIEMAFAKKHTDRRKSWLDRVTVGVFV
jgi:DNA topoisomerase-2